MSTADVQIELMKGGGPRPLEVKLHEGLRQYIGQNYSIKEVAPECHYYLCPD